MHRDIKPENVLFSAGKAMLADFGLARALSEGQRSITVAGMSLGTPAYMSPEQAQGLETIDHRSDIYALGCILFETVAGQPPFTGPGMGRIIQQHVQAPPPPLGQFRAGVPERLEGVVRRALAKDPAERWQSAEEMQAALSEAPGSAPPARSGEARPLRTGGWWWCSGRSRCWRSSPSFWCFSCAEKASPCRTLTGRRMSIVRRAIDFVTVRSERPARRLLAYYLIVALVVSALLYVFPFVNLLFSGERLE